MRIHGPFTCKRCGIVFSFESSNKAEIIRQFCTNKCSLDAKRRTAIHSCQGCGKQFRPASRRYTTYCSRECSFRDLKANSRGPKPKFCTVHFQNCERCGLLFASRWSRKFCSRQCLSQSIIKPPRTVACSICSAPFVKDTQGPSKYCSAPCAQEGFRHSLARIRLTEPYRDRKSEHSRLRKARAASAFVAPVNRKAIYERDAWICGICHRKVDKKLSPPHPMSR